MRDWLRRLRRVLLSHRLCNPEVLQQDPWVAIDCETTGLHPKRDRILQIAFVPFDKQTVFTDQAACFEIKTEHYSSTASVVHGLLSGEGVWLEHEALQQVALHCQHKWIVGHFVTFDRDMIEAACQRHRITWQAKGYIDTMQLALKLEQMHTFVEATPNPQLFTLAALCQRFQLPLEDEHTASGDALATALLFQSLFHRFEERKARLPVIMD
ncbi:MAG: 3'-5' exonuclease [Cytophagales bacterium]|nr:3'-5' exonuclease [Bernardetiaceae bacterium]MDW8211601.1 3'-5' exonuclease [Cytophagales bacterium]